MAVLNIGDTAPAFTLPSDGGGTVSLSDFKGRKVVLYFYPKDDTPGCTAESCDFRDNFKNFSSLNTVIIGISRDSIKHHDKFKAKYGLNFPLVSDEKGEICQAYGVWTQKSTYGKKYMGIERSTFLIHENGKIAALWRKVKVDGHAEEVQKAVMQ
jgi:thioredoxin-dependent peroxiredoxin